MDALGGLLLGLFFLLLVVFALFLVIPLLVDWTTWAAEKWQGWYTRYKDYQAELKAIKALELNARRQADTEACSKEVSDFEKFKDCMRGKNWVYPGDKGYQGVKP